MLHGYFFIQQYLTFLVPTKVLFFVKREKEKYVIILNDTNLYVGDSKINVQFYFKL